MTLRTATTWALVSACHAMLICAAVPAQSDTAELKANPFDRPEFVLNLGQAEAPRLFEPTVELELRATMVTSNGALANINGEILSVGERIEDYRVARIVEGRVPGIDEQLREQLVRFAQTVRKGSLRKRPGIAETIDWALALVAVGAEGLSTATLRKTLGALLKNQEDLERVLEDLPKLRR